MRVSNLSRGKPLTREKKKKSVDPFEGNWEISFRANDAHDLKASLPIEERLGRKIRW